jgi:hypothetical protein
MFIPFTDINNYTFYSNHVSVTPNGLYAYKPVPLIKPINNSISGYSQVINGTMWIDDIYCHIRSFLDSKSRHELWVAHKRYLQIQKPPVYTLDRKPNILYIKWSYNQIRPNIYLLTDMLNFRAIYSIKQNHYKKRKINQLYTSTMQTNLPYILRSSCVCGLHYIRNDRYISTHYDRLNYTLLDRHHPIRIPQYISSWSRRRLQPRILNDFSEEYSIVNINIPQHVSQPNTVQLAETILNFQYLENNTSIKELLRQKKLHYRSQRKHQRNRKLQISNQSSARRKGNLIKFRKHGNNRSR